MFVNFNILNQLGSPAINSNTFANRPAAGQTGRLFVSTDTYEIYRDNGTTWDLIGGPGSSTITGTGTATQVAYFTSSQAIGSSANLFWDNTNGFLGVGTAAPTTRIEAVKTDGIGIYANFTTNAGSGSSTTGIYSKNTTNSSGYAAVIEETTPNTTAGQYPLLIKHSLSSGTAGVGMGTGLQFQLPDDAGTFKTTQLTIETINAAAATYATRYRFNVQNNGSSTPVAYINATGLGIFTATPGAALDIHSTGIMAQLNSTSATANSLLAFQRSGSGLWRIGDNYGGGTNYFELFNTVLGINAMQVFAATNKTSWLATETYTTGLARGNYFDYNLSVAAGGSFSSPNAITALTATLDLTLAGNATIPSGARSGLDAYNSIAFTGAGTLTHNQGTQIRAYSNLTAGWAFNGSATGTITHLAGLRALFPDNSGSAVNVTNNYALLLNDQTANTGTVTYTNRWGVYQEGASDLNYFAANTLIGTTVNAGYKLDVSGSANATTLYENGTRVTTTANITGTTNRIALFTGTNTLGNSNIYYNSGLIGIGTANPVTALNLSNTVAQYITLTNGGADGVNDAISGGIISQSRLYGNNVAQMATILFRNNPTAWYKGEIAFCTNDTDGTNPAVPATERVRITSAGLVGIGTNAPAKQLDIKSSVSSNTAQLVVSDTSTQRLYLGTFSDNGYISFGGTYQGAWSANGSNAIALINFSAVSGASAITFGTSTSNGAGPTERARFTAGGNFLIGTTTDAGQKLQVNGVVATDGVKFPATQVASADVNTLDDYEEGTWTPDLEADGQIGTFTISTQTGNYTKIGNTVYCDFIISWTAIPGTGARWRLIGLPFTYNATRPYNGITFSYITGVPRTNGLYAQLTPTGGGLRSAFNFTSDGDQFINVTTGNNISATGTIQGSFFYRV